MNEFPPIASPTDDTPLAKAVSLPALARAQRWVWVGALAHVAAMLALMAGQPTASETPTAWQSLLILLALALLAFCAIVVAQLISALRMKGGWVAIILSLFSLIGLFVLLSINRLATRKLRAAGYRVSFFGAKAP